MRHLLPLAALLALLSAVGCRSAEPAAVVNGEAIAMEELHQELVARFGVDVMRDLIHQRLIRQEMEARGVTLPEGELELWVADFRERPDARAMLESGRLTEERLRTNLATVVPLYHLVLQPVPEEERKSFLDQNRVTLEQIRARHVLLATRDEAEEVRRLLKEGGDFESVARERSLDSNTRDRGGDLGYFTRAEIDPSVTEVAFALEEGEISPVITTRLGYHVLQVTGRRMDYETLRRRVMEAMAAPRVGEYLERLRSRAEITTKFEGALEPPEEDLH